MSFPEPNAVRAAILAALRRHHRQVLGYTTLTAAGALALWGVAYGLAYWIVLFLLSAVQGGEARLPQQFDRVFAYVALGSVAVAALEHWLRPDARPRDHKTAAEVGFDFLFAIPRVTVAIWGNLSAWRTLRDRELEQAVQLVERVWGLRRLSVQEVPQDLPEEETRDATLFTLMLIQILEMRQEDGVAWLFPASAAGPAGGSSLRPA